MGCIPVLLFLMGLNRFEPHTSDTLYVQVFAEQLLSVPMTERTVLSRISTVAIQHDWRDSVPSWAPQSLLGNQILEIATIDANVMLFSLEELEPTLVGAGAFANTHEVFTRRDSISTVCSTSGSIEKYYSVVGTRSSFYRLGSFPTSDDFPAFINQLEGTPALSETTEILFGKTILLTENTTLSLDTWSSLDLPGGSRVWGEHNAQEIPYRFVDISRRMNLECHPGNIPQVMLSVVQQGRVVPQSFLTRFISAPEDLFSISSDTVSHELDIYFTLADTIVSSDVQTRPGLVVWIPYLGPIADSLAVGRIPSLEEMGWTGFEIGMTALGKLAYSKYFEWPSTRAAQYTDDLIRSGTGAEVISNADHYRYLRANLGDRITAIEDAHHIVPLRKPEGAIAREILDEVGIGIDDALNGVGLEPSFHGHLHTLNYMNEVTRLLANVRGNRYAIEQVLNDIRSRLLTQTFPY